MDKYEYNLKLEEITKLADQGYYEDAADIIDTIDWRRVRNVRTLCMISEIYEEVGRLQDSKADKNRKIYNGMIKSYFYQFMGPKPPKRK